MRKLIRRLRYLVQQKHHARELAEEMEFHRSMTGARAFGNATLAREDARGVWLSPWLESVWQDLRVGARLLCRSPVSTTVAVLTMALGIGANTAVYSLVDGAMFRLMPVPDPDRLVFFTETTTYGVDTRSVTMQTFERLRDGNRTLAGLAAYDGSRISATVDGNPEMVLGDFVTAHYFEVMGVRAAIGRTLVPSDDRPDSAPVAVISDAYWRHRFGRDPLVAGRRLLLGRMPFIIVGVTPAEFHGRRPSGPAADVTLPMAAHAQLALRDHTTFELVARLRPGVSRGQAGADLEAIYRHALDEEPAAAALDRGRRRLDAASGAYGEVGGSLGPADSRQVLTVIAIVGMLLLMACVNVATLLLARATARGREIAVRLSIGAGRLRLTRQLLTESMLLAALGGGVALLVARSTADVLTHVLPIPELTFNPARDAGALLFTGGLSVLTGLLFGLAPAAAALRIDVSAMLKGSDAGRTSGVRRHRAATSLVIAQVALSVTLLVATGLLVRSLSRLHRVNPGIDAERILTAGVYPALLSYDRAREILLYRQLLETLAATPGIESAAVARYAIGRDGLNFVAPRLFTTLGVPLAGGRDVSAADVASAARVAVINEAAANEFYPGESAIGRQVPAQFSRGVAPLQIVGIVRNVSTSYRRPPPRPAVYAPYTLAPAEDLGQANLFIRTRQEPASMAPAARRAVRSVEPDLALLNLEPLSRELEGSVDAHRATATLLGVCALLALVLVAIGLYGTMSQAVARRSKELGIRISLGASRADMLIMVLRESTVMVAIGFAIGIPLSIASARGLSNLLFGIGVADPVTLAAVVVLMLAVAVTAGYVPASRAARVDPIVALRCE